LSASQVSATNITASATAGDITTGGASVSASGTLALNASANGSQSLNNSGGTLSAGQLQLTVANIDNQRGLMIQTGTGDTTIALTSATGSLNNSAGRIAANSQSLTLAAQNLTNTDGKIEHAGSGTLTITAGALNGQRGQITSNGSLSVNAASINHNAASTRAKHISLTASTLSNRGGEIVQSGSALDTQINISGALDNKAGTITSNGDVSLSAAGLSNQAGIIQAAGTWALNINIATDLDNSAGGQLAAGGGATVNVGSLSNSQGQITAGATLDITSSGAVDNRKGLMAANGALTLTAASLDNTRGTVAAVHSALSLTTAGTTLNDSGHIQAASSVSLNNQGLSNTQASQVPASPVPNRGGSITGRSISIDTHRQALNNTQGTIAATQALTLQTGALNNDAGLIQAGSALVMDTHGQQMTNTHAAAYAGYAGAAGGITAQGALTLSSGDFNNSAGLIAAKGTFSASTAQVSNSGGQMAGQAGVSFTSTGFDNQNGQLQALGDININAGTGTLSNSGGLIRSAGSTSVLGASINNSNTLGTDQGIEGSNVSLTANTLANNSGAILADNNASFTSAGSLNNSAGLISAGNSASLTDSSASKTLAIANSAGTLIAGQNFGIAAASLGGDGKLLSKGSLSLDLSADFNNSGELTANGNASVRTTASISNSGTLQAGNTLSLAAANINNSATGIINAGTTKLNASTALVNRGLIDGVDTQINAGTLSNIGTGRIYGNTLSIAATTLSNDAETTGATLAARTRLDIGATNITNRGHALIFSAGDMAIGASLDANRQAAGQAASLNNASATIEALGNLDINAAQVRNTNEHFLYDTPLASIETRREDPSGRYYFIYERRTYTPVATSSDPAKILAGGTIRLNANSTYNYASHIVAGAGLNVTGAAITNADVQAPQSVVDSGTTYTLVHYPQTGNCGFIKWNCRRARDEWVTGPYSNSSQSTVAVSQPSPATGSNTQLTGAASTSVTANLSAAGSANAQARQAGIVEVPVNIASSTVTTSAPVAGATGVDGARSAQVNAQTQTIDAASPVVIRTSTPNTTIPNTSLFKANPNPAARYFVETDPRFASYKTWLGSDYMLTALALDPNVMQKRLGDGFYEQRLIREQVAKLTGQRFLGDYSNDDQQYQALMDDGITYARAHNLRPGIALSAAQMAQLTSDIVWLVEQTVTLPDGTQAKALVPQVYARVRQGDLDGTGALMAGKSVNINISGELINSATIAGKSAGKSQNAVNINANNALNTGRITGDAVTVVAANDLNNIGGRIDAASSLNVI
ncbi:MAG: beta strand repeat-containing protein, partial [Polaromonas sp.]